MTKPREWVGGHLTIPVPFEHKGRLLRPELILWAELPERILIGCHLIDPEHPRITFAESLMEAMAKPMKGPPRKPDTIRVEELHLAQEIKNTLTHIEVLLGPTPEIDEMAFEIGKRLIDDGLDISPRDN